MKTIPGILLLYSLNDMLREHLWIVSMSTNLIGIKMSKAFHNKLALTSQFGRTEHLLFWSQTAPDSISFIMLSCYKYISSDRLKQFLIWMDCVYQILQSWLMSAMA